MNMNFGTSKTTVEVIKEGALQGTCFKHIYSGINSKWYRKSWKNKFDELKNIDQNYYCSDYYDIGINRYKVKCGTSLRFWEDKGWINYLDPYAWFSMVF